MAQIKSCTKEVKPALIRLCHPPGDITYTGGCLSG